MNFILFFVIIFYVLKRKIVFDNKNEKKKENKKNEKEIKKEEINDIKEASDNKKKKDKENKKVHNTYDTKKTDKVINSLNKIDNNRNSIILFVVGFLIATLLFRCILWPDRIATLKDGTQPIVNIGDESITADELYESLKESYSIESLLNLIDDVILTNMYEEDEQMKEEIQSTAEYYYSVYEQSYGYTKEQFLEAYGFQDEESFLESLTLDYRRNKYYEDYALGLVTDDEIEKYYEEDVFGDVDSKHILVSIGEENGLSDEEAKKLAQEIIAKLDSGTSWDDVISEYKDQIIDEELGYQAFNANLDSAYLEECKNLEVGTYSKSPVLSSYGYHIVYKIDQKDKPELDSVKEEVREVLADEKKNDDENLYYKALIHMREEANIEFFDTKFNDAYNEYISSFK